MTESYIYGAGCIFDQVTDRLMIFLSFFVSQIYLPAMPPPQGAPGPRGGASRHSSWASASRAAEGDPRGLAQPPEPLERGGGNTKQGGGEGWSSRKKHELMPGCDRNYIPPSRQGPPVSATGRPVVSEELCPRGALPSPRNPPNKSPPWTIGGTFFWALYSGTSKKIFCLFPFIFQTKGGWTSIWILFFWRPQGWTSIRAWNKQGGWTLSRLLGGGV